MLRAYTFASSTSSAITLPISCSGSSYLRRAYTHHTRLSLSASRRALCSSCACIATPPDLCRNTPGTHNINPLLAQASFRPDGVPDNFDIDPLYTWLLSQTIPDIVHDEIHSGATHRRECQLEIDNAIMLLDSHNQAHIDDT